MYKQNEDAPLALVFGHDDLLSRTRGWLLSAAGYRSLFVSSLRGFRETSLAEPVRLIVVCQSLSAGECAAVADFAAEHVQQARLLVLFGQRMACEPNGISVILDATSGPAVFVNTAKRMLASQAALTTH